MVAEIWRIKMMFAEFRKFKNQLPKNNILQISQSGLLWSAEFEWYAPTDATRISEIEGQASINLPQDYRIFLSEVSDGAILFREKEYSQWGFIIYGTRDLIPKQALWRKSLPLSPWKNLIAFGEFLGEANVLAFDIRKRNIANDGYLILEGSAYDEFQKWTVVAESFQLWTRHLIESHGDKYWLKKADNGPFNNK
jgi:hypothetical protein